MLLADATVTEVDDELQVPVVDAIEEVIAEDVPLPLLKLSVKMVVCAMPIKGNKKMANSSRFFFIVIVVFIWLFIVY
jgi:hypothetical protein